MLFSGAVQGLLLAAVLLLTHRGRRSANALLAAMLLSSTFVILPKFFMSMGELRTASYTWEVTYLLTAVAGPLFYFYTRSLLYPDYKPRLTLVVVAALLPGVLRCLHWRLSGMNFDATFDLLRANMETAERGADLYICFWCVTSITYQKLYAIPFVALAWRHVRRTEARLLEEYSGNIERHITWLKVLAAMLVLTAIHAAVSWMHAMVTGVVTIEWWMYLHSLMSCLFIQCVAVAALFLPEGFATAVAELPARNRRSPVEDSAAKRQLRELQRFMDNSKPHRIESLRLADLAGMLSMPSRVLSELINDRFKMNYHDFINTYRVEDAKAMLRDPGNDKFTLVAVAREAGFHSKTSFNRVFKKHCGVSPSEYRRFRCCEMSRSPSTKLTREKSANMPCAGTP